jgi:hypothetical protein
MTLHDNDNLCFLKGARVCMINQLFKAFRNVSLAVLITLSALSPTFSSPVTEADVRTVIINWLIENPNRFGEQLGTDISEIKLYKGGMGGSAGYYLVTLEPNGWVILPADDDFWPIQSFGGARMTPELFENTAWHEVTRFDGLTATSLNRASSAIGSSNEISDIVKKNRSKWRSLSKTSESVNPRGSRSTGLGLSSQEVMMVYPLLKNQPEAIWSQGEPLNDNSSKLRQLSPTYHYCDITAADAVKIVKSVISIGTVKAR